MTAAGPHVQAELPWIDEHTTVAAAGHEVVWSALLDEVARAFSGPARLLVVSTGFHVIAVSRLLDALRRQAVLRAP